ncbi:MAG: hypothetical protein JWO19_2202 [Bryobacterales bacterium]|nr:hypothetical protein [Bryobacterales bacterium]
MLTTRALRAPVKQLAAPSSDKPSPLGAVASPSIARAGTPVHEDPQQTNPLRRLAFCFGLAFVFTVFGVVPELMFKITGMNTYVIYWVAPAAILGTFCTGGIRRTFQHRASWYWLAFFLWMVVGIPFSYWKGGSTSLIYDYSRVCMTMMLVIGGLATKWKEIRAVFYTIGIAGVVNLLTARMFAKEQGGRMNMESASGTIGNSNDLAAHLILVLPFILFIAMDRRRNPFLRYAMLPVMAYGVWVILGTASRGGLVALCAVFLFMLLRATPMQRVLAALAAVVLAVGSFAILPGATLNRLGTLFGQENDEAQESSGARSYLFKTSVRYTLQHPIVGIGLGQFSSFEGNQSRAEGKHGSWHETHCSWTQISSECGIPALLFVILGISSALVLVHRTWRKARTQGFRDISDACFCYLVAMVGFLVAITFLANAYRFYLPAMIGLAISMSFVARRHMSAKAADDRRLAGIIAPRPLTVR